jgi:hypothetical protein
MDLTLARMKMEHVFEQPHESSFPHAFSARELRTDQP